MSIGLTQRQKEIALIIEKHINKGYGSPTVREIAAILKISPKAVQDHINALCKKGVFKKENHKSRGLRKIDNNKFSENSENSTFQKEIVKLNLKENITEDMELFEDQFIDTKNNINYKLNNNDNKDYIAFVLSDDFDTPKGVLKKGDIAIIELGCEKIKNRSVVATKKDSSYSLATYLKTGKKVELLFYNHKLFRDDISLKDVIGRLVEIRRRFKDE